MRSGGTPDTYNGIEMNQIRAERLACGMLAGLVLLAVCSCGAQRSGPSAIDPDAPTEFTATESGLKYRILRKGNGPKPRPMDRVEVDYSGWLEDGTIFDSSYGNEKPASFSLANLIIGWSEGMQLVGEGGMIELEIPAELGYGAQGQPPRIPPNSTLHFKVELRKIE